jgi:hypothetical protein
MTKRMILFSLGCCLTLAFVSGCCSMGRGPMCGPPCDMSCGPCNDCSGDCGPTCGPSRRCARPCREATCEAPCDSCGPCGPCCGPLWWFRPGKWVAGLFTCPTWCGPSCGECYGGEWCNDRPDFWDPCDEYGNYTGRGCSHCSNQYGNGYRRAARPPAEDVEEVPDDGVAPAPAPPQTPTPAVKQSQRPHKAARRVTQPPQQYQY